MSVELQNWQYELGGYVFGAGTECGVQSVDDAKPEVRDQDADRPLTDGVLFGRDYLAGRTISFEGLLVARDRDAARAYGALAQAWSGDAVRSTPGAVMTLRYKRPGHPTRRVYGRPRRLAPTDSATGGGPVGVLPVVMDFACTDPLTYDDEQRSTSVSLVARTGRGWTWPVSWPFAMGSSTGTIEGTIEDVGGLVPAPVEAVVYGPITNPVITAGDWRLELRAELAYDQWVTVDTRAMTVLRNDGASLGGTLTRASRLTKARLAPGAARVTFTGIDATRTATCVVSWRPARHGF